MDDLSKRDKKFLIILHGARFVEGNMVDLKGAKDFLDFGERELKEKIEEFEEKGYLEKEIIDRNKKIYFLTEKCRKVLFGF